MLEQVTVLIDGQHYPTRLHEHGPQPSYQWQPSNQWLESGYMEGRESTLKALKEAGGDLTFYRDGVPDTTLTGVVWGEIVNMYDDHFILHLDWK